METQTDTYLQDPLEFSNSRCRLPSLHYNRYETSSDWQDLIDLLDQGSPWFGIDFETTGPELPPELWKSKSIETFHTRHKVATRVPRLLQVSDLNRTVVVDFWEAGEMATPAMIACFKRMKDRGQNFVAHNAVFELETLLSPCGFYPDELPTIYDTMIAARVLDTEMRGDDTRAPMGLKDVVARWLGVALSKEQQDSDWHEMMLSEEQLRYAFLDPEITLALWGVIAPALEEWKDGFDLAQGVLLPTALMNTVGMTFDTAAHQTLLNHLEIEDKRLRADLDSKGTGIENHGSSQQVSKWVIDNFLVPGSDSGDPTLAVRAFNWRTTKTGLSLQAKYVHRKCEEFTAAGLFPEMVDYLQARIEWRRFSKLVQSFGRTLRYQVDPDGRLRGSFNPGAAASGRWSCSAPNLQQMPREKAYRALFNAPEGKWFVIADYSQIELRVAALLAHEDVMLQIFRDKLDIHTATAAFMFQKPLEDVTPDERKGAKSVNFGILFGAMAPTISLQTGLPVSVCQDFIDKWLGAYPNIRRWREEDALRPQIEGRLVTAGGRPIKLHKSHAVSQLYNYPVQSGACDVIARAFIRLHEETILYALDQAGVYSLREAAAHFGGDLPIKIAAIVHDELILEVMEGHTKPAQAMLERCMKQGLIDIFPEAAERDAEVVDADCVKSWSEKP